ncbi:MAG: GNAT family N-acetyltransferase, partial [Chitinophagaceae bacterium]
MNQGEYTLQEVAAGEVAALQKISRQTFYETFSADNSEENMTKYLEQQLSLDQLRNELNDPNAIFYFAKHQTEIIGYLKLNFGASQTEMQEPDAVELERIYVLASYHGKKIGQLLYDKA